MAAWFGTVFLGSLYLQQHLGLRPLLAGLAFLPSAVFSVIGNLLSGRSPIGTAVGPSCGRIVFRQVDGAVAIAIFGALVADRSHFLTGLRTSSVVAAILLLAAVAVAQKIRPISHQ